MNVILSLTYGPFGWSQGARKVYPFGHRVVRQTKDEAPSARSSLADMTEVLIKDGRALKHVQVREYVRSLVSGMSPGSPAPSERELVAQFGVARMTVRQAMDALVVEGLLERIPGKGTFVARPRRTASTITSYSEEMARRGMLAESVTLLARREQAGPGVARALNITEGDPVIHWKRLRRADGSPMCIEDAFLNEVLLPGFLQSGMPTSLYDALEQRGLRPTWAEDSINADVCQADEATHLEVASGDPVLRHSRRALNGEKVVEVSRSVFRADKYTLWVQIGQDY